MGGRLVLVAGWEPHQYEMDEDAFVGEGIRKDGGARPAGNLAEFWGWYHLKGGRSPEG